MSQAKMETQSNDNAWLEHFLPHESASQIGAFEFARASPYVLGTSGSRVGEQTLAQAKIFSPQSESFPATEVSQWAADNPRPDRSFDRNDGVEASLYHPLEDPYDIRVLEVHPGLPGERLHASLHHCSIGFDMAYIKTISPSGRFALSTQKLDGPVWYTALSYTWGQPVFDATIYFNGHAKPITQTLETALKHFRHRTDSIMLWVDQVCINQTDLEEKKQQIPLMSRIYSRAFNTVVWLGEADASTEKTFDFLNDITVRLQYTNEVSCPEGLTDALLPPGDSVLWTDLINFFSRPWFQRLWIIQEVVLSREVWIMCGRHILPWRRLSTPCSNMTLSGISNWLSTRAKSIKDAEATAATPTNGWSACDQLGREQEHYQSSGGVGSTLFNLIRNYRNALCQDPRDKVYGVLALTSAGQYDTIRVDYTSDYPFMHLYHDIAKNKIMYLKSRIDSDPNDTRILVLESIHWLLVEIDGPTLLSSGLPSWAPDWSTVRQTNPIAGILNSHNFRASGDSKHDYAIDEKDDGRLVLGAGLVDELANITGIFPAPSISYDNIANGNEDLLECFKLCASLQNYPNSSHTVFDAFWRSMVAGVDETGRAEAPEAFAEIFSVLLDASTGKEPSLADQSYTARQKRPEGKGKLTPSHLGSRTAGTAFRNARTAMQNAMRNRRLEITSKGFVGLFPGCTTKGDAIHVVGGCPIPYVTRRIEGGNWQMIGECYVHGIMKGEALQDDDFRWDSIIVR